MKLATEDSAEIHCQDCGLDCEVKYWVHEGGPDPDESMYIGTADCCGGVALDGSGYNERCGVCTLIRPKDEIGASVCIVCIENGYDEDTAYQSYKDDKLTGDE
jgi:hypothetical protein